MKRLIAFAVALSMVLALVAVPVFAEKAASSARDFDIETAYADFKATVPESVSAGEEFSVVVAVRGNYQANVINLQLNFDKEQFEFVPTNGANNVAYGPVITSAIQLGGFPMVATNSSGNSLNLGMIMPGNPISGSGELYTARFKAKQAAVFDEYSFVLKLTEFAYFPAGGVSTPITDHEEEVGTYDPAWLFNARLFVESPDKARVGEDIEVTLNIEGEYKLSGLQAYFYYDNDIFTITEFVGAPLVAAENVYHTENDDTAGVFAFNLLAPNSEISDTGCLYTFKMHVKDDADSCVAAFSVELSQLFYSEPGSTVAYPITEVTTENSQTEIIGTHTVHYIVDGAEFATQLYAQGDIIEPVEFTGQAPESMHFAAWDGLPEDMLMPGNDIYVYPRFEADPVKLSVVADPGQVEAGDEFEVSVIAEGIYSANCMQIYLNYDAENFTAVDAQNGPVLNSIPTDAGAATIDYETNPGSVRAIAVSDSAISEEGVIFTATLKANETAKAGIYELTPEVIAFNSAEDSVPSDIPYEIAAGSIEILERQTYTLTYIVNGEPFETKQYAEGETIEALEYSGAIPEGHHFVEWSGMPDDMKMPAENISVIAVFEPNEYTVTWQNEDGTTLATANVPYGEVPAYEGEEPAKEATAQYTYIFSGWTPEVVAVSGDATYTATFEATVNEYTVTFVYGYDLSMTAVMEVAYGSAAIAPELPEYFWWTFTGWDKDFSNITESITVTARYAERGDVDQDGDVDIADALLILRYCMGLSNASDTSVMDIDMNGSVTMMDALLVQRHVMGLLSPNLNW